MPNTRKKVIKTVYKDDENSDMDDSGDFSDSGSDAHISDNPSSSDEEKDAQCTSSSEEKKSIKKYAKCKPKQIKFAKKFISKINKQNDINIEDEDIVSSGTFSVKDLTDADKLLPPILNLSESESSDEEETTKINTSEMPSTSNFGVNSQGDNEIENSPAEYRDVWSKSVYGNSEEIAKLAFHNLEQHATNLEETKATFKKYVTTQQNSVDINNLLAMGEDEILAPKKKLLKSKIAHDSESDVEDWEEVKDAKLLPQQGLQLVVDFPDASSKRNKAIDIEMMMKRKINRVKKEYQVFMHKVHVLSWLAHGNHISGVLNDQNVMSATLSLIPSKNCYPEDRVDVKYVEQITKWYRGMMNIKLDKSENKFKPNAPQLKDNLLKQIKNKTVSSNKFFVYLFVSLLRALGLQCRVVLNFVTLPLKPPSSELCSLSTKLKTSVQSKDNKEQSTKIKTKERKSTSKKRKVNKNIDQLDGNADLSDDSNIIQLDGNDDDVSVKVTRSTRLRSSLNLKKNGVEDVSPSKKPRLQNSSEKDKLNSEKLSKNKKSTLAKAKTPEFSATSNQKIKRVTSKHFQQNSNSINETSSSEKSSQSNLRPRRTRSKPIESRKGGTTIDKTNKKKSAKIETSTDEKNAKVSSEYFSPKIEALIANEKIKKLSLSRKRSHSSSTNPPSTTKNLMVENKRKTKSAQGTSVLELKTSAVTLKTEINKKSDDKERRRKGNRCDNEDKNRVSHKDLMAQARGSDVKPVLMHIIKNKIKEAKYEAKSKLVKGKVKDESDDYDSDYLPEENIVKKNRDSEDEFMPVKISPGSKPRKLDRRVLSTDSNPIVKQNKVDIWCEVYVEELEQWICVDVVTGKVHCTNEIYKNLTHPVAYIVGWNNSNHLKDVTRRYVPHWNTVTRKLRAEPNWWITAIKPWIGPKTSRDKEEDEYLDKLQLDAPLPKTISEYKNHPLYALKRHLLKFEALYPPDAPTLGFVRGEAVYARECVNTCRSRDTWLKEAKVVKLGENPYKIVKARPKWDKLSNKLITDKPLEIFGPWQVQDYEPPVAENGIVPRNAYGNVELFKDCMLPKGTVHIKLPGLNKVANKLKIDCAPAMTGFDFHGGWTHPVFDGFVVCKEFEEIITDAWVKEQEEQERKENEKIEARVYGNWKKLIKGLLIKERLKNKYGFTESSTSKATKRV